MTIDIEKIKAAALAVTGWKLDHAWLDTSEDESAAVVGHIDEDGNEYAVITVDCDQYFQGQDSLPLAKFYAQANPSAVLELIDRLKAAEANQVLSASARQFKLMEEQLTVARENLSDILRKNDSLNTKLEAAEREAASKQADIDRLMLEYCPSEMTEDQLRIWGENQIAMKEKP